MNSTKHPYDDAANSIVAAMLREHNRVLGALADVLRMHYESAPQEQLLEALDELTVCARSAFVEVATLKSHLGGTPDKTYLVGCEAFLGQMSSLRLQVEHADRQRLLPQLMSLDDWLTTHVSDEILAVLYRRLERMPEGEELMTAGRASHE